MAQAEDPPYLTVGTEVSAKYRGAFCEATIKIAKKLVKCKVSYGKGLSSVVTSDLIKGSLKVGGQVEVRQPDGQFQQANITKLTDQSTYTVVFDDGDERTLKRSSLCLKGGRHFHESESLDHLPLTDPENFGTPVMNSSSKKPGRKRRRGSQSPSSSSPRVPTSKRSCSYPSEFPVGKAVFLENDRRRSSWLPAVIVPAHYVLEDSDMTPDTICLRSFKDGRYFAATKKELHEFSPSKEPLSSMLEGEIQAMYMCKPAIERAMAYIDTGDLPWDMDLFDHNSERPTTSHPLASDHSTSDDDESQRSKDRATAAEAKNFEVQLHQFHESRGTPIQRQPTIGQCELNLFQFYRLVKANGGMDRVTMEMKWRSLYLQLGLPLNSSASYALRQAYRKYLYQFELHEKNKAKGGGSKDGWTRRNKPLPPSSDEEQDSSNPQQDQSNQDRRRQQDKLIQQDKVKRQDKSRPHDKVKQQDKSGECKNVVVKDEAETKVNGLDTKEKEREKGKRTVPPAHRTVKTVKTVRVEKLATHHLPKPQSADELEEEEDKNCISDGKSEGSDLESTPHMVESSWSREDMTADLDCSTSLSASSLERGELGAVTGNLEQCPEGYMENDRVLVLYGKGKMLRTYEAKVKGLDKGEENCDYLVHYNGWNTRYDEWIDSARIVGKIIGPGKPRPHFNTRLHLKRKKTPKSASSSALFTPSNLPPSTPGPSGPSTSPKLVLSPSLQAILSSHTQQQQNVQKKEKVHYSISGKAISTKLSGPSARKIAKAALSVVTPTRPPDPGPSSGHPSRESSGGRRPLRGSRSVGEGGVQGPVRGRGSNAERTSRGKETVGENEQDRSTTPNTTASNGEENDSGRGTTTSKESNHLSPKAVSSYSLPGSSPPLALTSAPSLPLSSDDTSSNSGGSEDDQPITVRQEVNQLWSMSPPPAPPLSSKPAPSQPSTSASSSSSDAASPATALLCSEKLPGALVPKHSTITAATTTTTTISSSSPPSAMSLAEPAAQSLLSLSTCPTSFSSPQAPLQPPAALSPPSLSAHPLFPNSKAHFSRKVSPGPAFGSSPEGGLAGSNSPREDGFGKKEEDTSNQDNMDTSSEANSLELEECAEQKSLDSGSGSGSEKESSPLPRDRTNPASKCHLSYSPESKKKWRAQNQETNEECEKRKKARHADMNYTLDFCKLPSMSGLERVSLIQEHLGQVQRRWSDLKAELAYIERKRRRAKRKEREAAHTNTAEMSSNSTSSPPPSPHSSQLHSAIPCH